MGVLRTKRLRNLEREIMEEEGIVDLKLSASFISENGGFNVRVLRFDGKYSADRQMEEVYLFKSPVGLLKARDAYRKLD